MKIILRADVENLGRLGDVVTVKAGYGRNYLLPQGLAMLVTPGNLKAFELERKKLQARMDALRAAADDIAGKLESRLSNIAEQAASYDPESLELAENCPVVTDGVYVGMFFSSHYDDMAAAFQSALA